MNKSLVRIGNMNQGSNQCSILQSIEEATRSPTSYALIPRDFHAIGEYLKESDKYRYEIEQQLNRPEYYLKMRKFFMEKLLGKRIKSIEELFALQLDVARRTNYGLDVINKESRQKLNLLENYVERINYEYKHNFLGIDSKKESLNPLLQKYIGLYQEFNLLKEKNNDYFEAEGVLRQIRRDLSEKSLSYKKMLDAVDDLENERGSLNALEDFFRYSIQLSERMVDKAVRFENHVANTKDSYLMARNINSGFSAVLKAVQNSSSMISQLQNVLINGLSDMGHVVSDQNTLPYGEFEVLLKSRYEAVKGLVNRRDIDKERIIEMRKIGLLR